MTDLTIIVPAYNEAESLTIFLPQLIDFCNNHSYKLIVVNDGSNDETGEILEKYAASPNCSFETHKVNRGYGGAIKTGIRAAETKYLITIDADGQHDLQDVTALYERIVNENADMVVGSRMAHKDTSLYRSIGKNLIRWFAKLLLPIHIQDINSGIKIYSSKLAKRYIRLCPDNMAYSDIITMVFISKKNLVLEQPVNIRQREAGVSTIGTLTAIETVEEILNIVVLFNPMRVFFPVAFLSIVVSLAWGIPIVMKGRGVSTGALLGFSTGILFFFLGLLAEQLSRIRKNAVDE